jgi:hypothetical protein
MSTENKAATPAEPTRLGIDVTKQYKAYGEALDAARKASHDAHVARRAPLVAVETALDAAPLSWTDRQTVMSVVQALTRTQQDQAEAEIREAYEEATAQAEEAWQKVAGSDPLVKWLTTSVAEDQGNETVAEILNVLPATFAELRDMADGRNWCDTFEYYAYRATEAGALPVETIEYTRRIDGADVPWAEGREAFEGEAWKVTFRLPAYFRMKGGEHEPVGHWFVQNKEKYLTDVRFERVEPAPAPESEKTEA